MTTFSYDNANELVTMTNAGVDTTYTYDEWGRTVSKTMATPALSAGYTYTYGDKVSTGTSTFSDENNGALVYDRSGKLRQADGLWTRKYPSVSVCVRLCASIQTQSGLAFTAQYNPNVFGFNEKDHLGSIRGIRDEYAGNEDAFEYGPYGTLHSTTGANPPLFGFTAHPDLANYGPPVYYTPYRPYTPDSARWLTRDPMGMVDGPNMYEYVRDDPTNHVDPYGKWLWFAGCGISTWITFCGLWADIEALRGPQGLSVRHCTLGCLLGKCLGYLAPGWLVYSMNWWFENASDIAKEILGVSLDPVNNQRDNEAARFGATTCSQDPGSCGECCAYYVP